jgi:hypothetical protein
VGKTVIHACATAACWVGRSLPHSRSRSLALSSLSLSRALSRQVRAGKGGSNDPFLYTVVADMVSADGSIIGASNLVDPGLEVRLKRIEACMRVTEFRVPNLLLIRYLIYY